MSFSLWLLVFFPFSLKDVLWYKAFWLWYWRAGVCVSVCVCVCMCVYVCVCARAQSCPTLCNPIDCSHQSLLSIEFSRQEYWCGLPFPAPGDLPNPGIPSLWLLHWQMDSLLLGHLGSPGVWHLWSITPFNQSWEVIRCLNYYLIMSQKNLVLLSITVFPEFWVREVAIWSYIRILPDPHSSHLSAPGQMFLLDSSNYKNRHEYLHDWT